VNTGTSTVAPGRRVDQDFARRHLVELDARPRRLKGDAGHVFVIGGSRRYPGPPYLAGLSALRVGVDSARVITSAGHPGPAMMDMHVMPAARGELAVEDVAELAHAITDLRTQMDHGGVAGRLVLLVGPGLGGHPAPFPVLDALAAIRRSVRITVVVDGSLGGGERGLRLIETLEPAVILLNAREAAQLLSVPRDDRPIEDLAVAARRLLTDHHGAVLVKGDVDHIVTHRSSRTCHRGHPALTKNGTGDVLAGATAGLLARGLHPQAAGAAACHLVGTAAENLVRRRGRGFLATELVEQLARELHELGGDAPQDLIEHQGGVT
jgi:hydroxyethylthiazole kinase-like uncharacterized protein yjeF